MLGNLRKHYLFLQVRWNHRCSSFYPLWLELCPKMATIMLSMIMTLILLIMNAGDIHTWLFWLCLVNNVQIMFETSSEVEIFQWGLFIINICKEFLFQWYFDSKCSMMIALMLRCCWNLEWSWGFSPESNWDDAHIVVHLDGGGHWSWWLYDDDGDD